MFISSPGSVQAEVQLEVASPNMSVVYQVVSSMDNVGNFSIDRNATKIRSEQGNSKKVKNVLWLKRFIIWLR